MFEGAGASGGLLETQPGPTHLVFLGADGGDRPADTGDCVKRVLTEACLGWTVGTSPLPGGWDGGCMGALRRHPGVDVSFAQDARREIARVWGGGGRGLHSPPRWVRRSWDAEASFSGWEAEPLGTS